MPNSEQAIGISNREPPATPEAPHAPNAETTDSRIAAGREIWMPSVFAAAMDMMVMVIAAPFMLMVAPSGMDTEYMSLSRPSFSHSCMFTGMFAAEERVKNAVSPDSLKQRYTSGYGLRRRYRKMTSGPNTSTMSSMVPTSSNSRLPYRVNASRPFSDTLVNTRPMMPNGARLMTQRITWETPSATLARNALELSLAMPFMARPNRHAHIRMQM